MAAKPRPTAAEAANASGKTAAGAADAGAATAANASGKTAAGAADADAATAATGNLAAKDIAARLKDPAFQAEIEQAVRDLPPEKAAQLVGMLEASIRRRKLELYGYIAAAAIVIIGMVGALFIMGSARSGTFVGWVFLVPLGLAGLVMWLVGRRAREGQRTAREARRRPS